MMGDNGLMAGGMGRGRGIPLRDRPVATPGAARRPSRHCWVEGTMDSPGPWPGVVVEWRRDPASGLWSALVVYVVTDDTRPITVQAWVDSRYLRPVQPT